jgi:hypothetical protein
MSPTPRKFANAASESQNQQRNPNPQLLDRAKEQQDHSQVEACGNVSVRDAKRLRECRIGDCFATLIKNWAPEVPYCPGLLKPYIKHTRSAGASQAHGE